MGDIILNALLYVVVLILYFIETILCKILDIVYNMFEVFAGIEMVTLRQSDGTLVDKFLINVFFDNSAINYIFWGMACIGIMLTFVFAVASVIKKTFDSNDKHKLSYGQILTNCFKSIVIILLMSTIVGATITATNLLMQQIDLLFNQAQTQQDPEEIYFNEDDYATMFRILDTIGNFSLNSSYDNTYNINECYNQIRPDLQILGNKNFFKFTYTVPENAKGVEGNYVSWQKIIRDIGVATDYNQSIYLDEFNKPVNDAILAAMEAMRKDGSFKPFEYYKNENSKNYNGGAELGKTLMIAATFNAAKNKSYNTTPSLTDEIRGPFYRGEEGHDPYSRSDIEKSFSLDLDKFNHIIVLVGTVWLIKEFLAIIMNCIGRIFNMMLLYIVAPPFIASMPLDDGAKFKQWTTAFIIQALGIFGTFISVRLLILFIPIIMGPQLILFEDGFMDVIGKVIIVVGIGFTSSKAAAMISGILADNAGMQSIMAGDTGGAAAGALMNVGKKVGGLALGAGLAVGKGVANATGATYAVNKLGEKLGKGNQSMKDNFGLIGAAVNGFETKESAKEKKASASEQKQEKAQQEQSDFFKKAGSFMDSFNDGGNKAGQNTSDQNNPGSSFNKSGPQGGPGFLPKEPPSRFK